MYQTRLKRLREYLQKEKIDYFLFADADGHFSEYVGISRCVLLFAVLPVQTGHCLLEEKQHIFGQTEDILFRHKKNWKEAVLH